MAESAPAKGRFFYDGGCGFTKHTRSAFEQVRDRPFALIVSSCPSFVIGAVGLMTFLTPLLLY